MEQAIEQPDEIMVPLGALEARLRTLIPNKLYADVWINPSVKNLTKAFNHLRTLHRILYGYLPRQVITSLPEPGVSRFQWDEGTLMFTDLSGFTPLLEKTANYGKEGAQSLLDVLNGYFAEMIQIINNAGGNLLEFTGDALLAQFPRDQRETDAARAVRAGLRMQRAMKKFENIELFDADFTLGMRIGLHRGNFMAADIGTPYRMEHVLLGSDVLRTKQAEGAGQVGRVCLSREIKERVDGDFRFEEGKEDHVYVVDDLGDKLGDYDIVPSTTRLPSMVLFDTSKLGLITAITDAVEKVEPLASFIPHSVLNLLVEHAAARGLPPDFPEATLLFVNVLGLPDKLDQASPEDVRAVISEFSRAVSLINAEIEAQGGVMKKVTYHHAGPDIMAFFGVPVAHTNDAARAAEAARGILSIVTDTKTIAVGGETLKLSCHVGITKGRVFAAEIGDLQGRREFNVMGNTVNTAARLMDRAESDQILISEEVHEHVGETFETERLEKVQLKGRSKALTLYALGKAKR